MADFPWTRGGITDFFGGIGKTHRLWREVKELTGASPIWRTDTCNIELWWTLVSRLVRDDVGSSTKEGAITCTSQAFILLNCGSHQSDCGMPQSFSFFTCSNKFIVDMLEFIHTHQCASLNSSCKENTLWKECLEVMRMSVFGVFKWNLIGKGHPGAENLCLNALGKSEQ